MRLSKSCVFLLLVFIVGAQVHRLQGVESRPLPLLEQQHYSKVLGTLGISCKCCDGKDGICTSTWDHSISCTKLECLPYPWKLN
ncbi:hypothetical protein AQUCO_00900835v1 [Aquilegia coerulea]|uniref:Uncharacterized protein n=1 Tax=Aquilegia coerulea TaxID=218851 RepID=A0A2G5EFM4_AQUCA|nr:hypothetical protein AQUCO_00900835v1 [Aquilegia coerulea]